MARMASRSYAHSTLFDIHWVAVSCIRLRALAGIDIKEP